MTSTPAINGRAVSLLTLLGGLTAHAGQNIRVRRRVDGPIIDAFADEADIAIAEVLFE
jgi:hypothetical protein